ncbi:glycosyltransferase family 2 protein [Streptomyces sp. RFCAC02]|uniref:glycosyltransferase family 2 protein n=1 Tax=Streptomyces sp. RFCAC02 TaxID=2499143 RepID=UPI001F0DAA12|nr:glycosyltransferase family 2 protein [Streptomyces sp. RFCAC02]
MPRFSVIVPAYQVQAYLPACLTSVLTQDAGDLELIVVDDASPDACGDIIAEFAAADPRVTGLRLDRTAGPGPARNAALDHARGEYVLFLDGDDILTPGALAAIDARLTATGDPQLLVHDHAVLSFDGTLGPGLPRDLLTAPSAAPRGTSAPSRPGHRCSASRPPRGAASSGATSSPAWDCASRPATTRTFRSPTPR